MYYTSVRSFLAHYCLIISNCHMLQMIPVSVANITVKDNICRPTLELVSM